MTEKALTVDVRDELETARRNVYRLQTGGVRLCDALRTIANGCDNPEQVAKKALAHKEPDPDWNRIEHLQSEIERKDAEIEALRIAIDLARARECRCPKPLPPGCYGNAALTKDQQQ